MFVEWIGNKTKSERYYNWWKFRHNKQNYFEGKCI